MKHILIGFLAAYSSSLFVFLIFGLGFGLADKGQKQCEKPEINSYIEIAVTPNQYAFWFACELTEPRFNLKL